MASSPTTDVARRPGGRSAALAIRSDQGMWDERQLAALTSMGIPKEAPRADLAVFLHQAQRTGLDPFTRQIYLIYRKSKENGQYVNKPTMQVGIDGYRLIRDRIAKREDLRVEYEPTTWWDLDGQPHQAWLWDEPPAGCTMAITVDGRRFSSTLRFKEYAQYNRSDGSLTAMWAAKPAHMIEKCAEADVLRRAFPQDLSGLVSEDEVNPDDVVQPQAAPARPSAAQIRQQRQQPVKAEVVDAPPPPEEPPAEPDGEDEPEAERHARKLKAAQAQGRKLFGDDDKARHRAAAEIIGADVDSFADLSADDLDAIAGTFGQADTAEDLARLLHGEVSE